MCVLLLRACVRGGIGRTPHIMIGEGMRIALRIIRMPTRHPTTRQVSNNNEVHQSAPNLGAISRALPPTKPITSCPCVLAHAVVHPEVSLLQHGAVDHVHALRQVIGLRKVGNGSELLIGLIKVRAWRAVIPTPSAQRPAPQRPANATCSYSRPHTRARGPAPPPAGTFRPARAPTL